MYVLVGAIMGLILAYILLEKEKEKGFNKSIVLVGGAFTGAILGHSLNEFVFLLAIFGAFYFLSIKVEEETAKNRLALKEEIKKEILDEINNNKVKEE